MTQHLHSTLVDGCYRCELGKDEERAFIAERREKLARWMFDRDYRNRSLCSSEDADWDEWVERNQDEWRDEASDLLAMLDEEGYL